MATTTAPMSGVPITLQNAQSALGNGLIIAPPPSFRNHTFIITGAVGVTAGAVQIETGTDPFADTNTWAPLGGGPVTVIATSDLAVELIGIYTFLRARISTVISGGGAPSVTVTYVGAKSY